MSIPASRLVDITNRTIGGGLEGIALDGLAVSTNANLPIGGVIGFGSSALVGAFFGTSSNEYAISQNYFLADTVSTKKPTNLYFTRFSSTACGAFLRGIAITNLGNLTAITSGTLNLSVDNTSVEMANLDFSSQTSFSGCATVIQTALRETVATATCTYSSQFSAFVIASGTTGDTSLITFAETGTLSDLIGLSEIGGGTISQGSDAQTLTNVMDLAFATNPNFISFATVEMPTTAQALELATWCNGKGTRFLYFMGDSSGSAFVPKSTACLGYLTSTYNGIVPTYNNSALCFFGMGCVASTDLSKLNGRKTLAYRQQNGLQTTVSDDATAEALLGNGYNFYGLYANASNQFMFYQNGQCSNDLFIDTYVGQVWLNDNMQNAWLNILSQVNTLPYNQAGYGLLRSASLDVINSGLYAGVIRQGVELSEAQIAQTTAEAGQDISEVLFSAGWYLQILNPTTAVRANRGTPVINFWYMDGGSVHRISATATTIL